MLLQVLEHPRAIRMRDLGGDRGVLEIAVAQVIGDRRKATACLEERDGDRVAAHMDGSSVVSSIVLSSKADSPSRKCRHLGHRRTPHRDLH